MLSTRVPTPETALDNILYLVVTDAKYRMYIKNNEGTIDEVKLGSSVPTFTDVTYDTTAEGVNAKWTFTLTD